MTRTEHKSLIDVLEHRRDAVDRQIKMTREQLELSEKRIRTNWARFEYLNDQLPELKARVYSMDTAQLHVFLESEEELQPLRRLCGELKLDGKSLQSQEKREVNVWVVSDKFPDTRFCYKYVLTEDDPCEIVEVEQRKQYTLVCPVEGAKT